MRTKELYVWPSRSSEIVWRNSGPNISTLLTNTILPVNSSYRSSHLYYNVYSRRILDSETECCMKFCNGKCIGYNEPILILRCGINENNIEILTFENKFKDSENLFNNIGLSLKRIAYISEIFETPIYDISVQSSSDFNFPSSFGIYIYLRSMTYLCVIQLYLDNFLVKHKIVFNGTVNNFLKYLKTKDTQKSIYSIVASPYDFCEISALLSNGVIIRLNFLEYINSVNIYTVEDSESKKSDEVFQCLIYGYNSDVYFVGGKYIYLYNCSENNKELHSDNIQLDRTSNKDNDDLGDINDKFCGNNSNNESFQQDPGTSISNFTIDEMRWINKNSKTVTYSTMNNDETSINNETLNNTESYTICSNSTHSICSAIMLYPWNQNLRTTFKSSVSLSDRTVRLESLRNKNVSLSNITALALHPIYPYILAAVDVKSSKVVVIHTNQNTNIPLAEFSIPLVESVNSRCRFIQWVYPISNQKENNDIYNNIAYEVNSNDYNTKISDNKDTTGNIGNLIFPMISSFSFDSNNTKQDQGLILYLGSYPYAIYAKISIQPFIHNIDEPYILKIMEIIKIPLGIWSLQNDRDYYVPKNTQLIESSLDLMDFILEQSSVDDNALAQKFHGLTGICTLGYNVNFGVCQQYKQHGYEGNFFVAPSTSKHHMPNIYKDALIVLGLNTCGRLTTCSILKIQNRDSNPNLELNNSWLYNSIQSIILNKSYFCANLDQNFFELMKINYCNKSCINLYYDLPRIVKPRESLRKCHNSDLENANEQFSKRKYYNSYIYNGLQILEFILSTPKKDINMVNNNLSYQDSLKIRGIPPVTNSFDYRREFDTMPNDPWLNEENILHIPSPTNQPYPLCTCRYFEMNKSDNSYHFDDNRNFEDKISIERPFDIVGIKHIDYSITLEELLSNSIQEGLDLLLTSELEQKEIQETNSEIGLNKENFVYQIPIDILNSLANHITCLPSLPVSKRMAKNYREYIRSKCKDKWKLANCCSRLKQPGCIIKYLIQDNQCQYNFLDNSNYNNLSSEYFIEINHYHDVNYEHNDNNKIKNKTDHANSLIQRGTIINEELIEKLEKYWMESLTHIDLKEDIYSQDNKLFEIDLSNCDLSSWYNYPLVTFENITSKIAEKQKLKTSILSFVETQLSNI
ncbi:hypothetical protein ACR3K2_12720 [Cryptosporidium serpentis]